MSEKRFTPEQEQEVARAYQDGASSLELAQRYGCHFKTVIRALRRQGVTPRPVGVRKGTGVRQFTDEQKIEIVRRWQAGESQAKIGKDFNAHQVTLSRLLVSLGVTPEPRRPRRASHGSWKGGRTIDGSGYVLVLAPDFLEMRGANGYIREHRLVMARHLGRVLKRHETVHHRNGDRADNQLENLELWIGGHPAGQRDAHCPTCTCFTH